MPKSVLKRLSSAAIAGLLVLITVVFTFRNLIYPSFFMDEAYYLGAARAVASGDLLLTGQSFDKPFLQAVLPALGIALAGDQPFAFRLMGFLFYLGAVVIWWKTLSLALGGQRSHQAVAFFFALSLFLNPLLLPYAGSVMGEPFILFFLGAMAFYWLKTDRASERGMAVSLAAAIATKQTALFWMPLLLFKWPRSEWMNRLKWFFKSTWWIWSLVLIFFLFNKKKFGAIQLIFHLMNKGSHGSSVLESVQFWTAALQTTTFGLAPYLLALIALGVFSLLKNKSAHDPIAASFRWAAIAAGIHFASLIVFRAPHYTRYLVILLPQLALAAVLALRLLQYHQRWLPGALTLPAIFFVALPLAKPPEMLNPGVKMGRDLMMVREEIPPQAVLNASGAWEFLPYVSDSIQLVGCIEPSCIELERTGRPLLKDHYVARIIDDKNVRIWRTSFVAGSGRGSACWKTKTLTETRALTQSELVSAFLEAVRIGDKGDVRDFQVLPADTREKSQAPVSMSGAQDWRLLGSEPVVKFNLHSREPKLAGHPLALRFRLVAHPEGSEDSRKRRNILSLRLEEARLGNADLTDLLQVAWKGYTIDLMPLDFYENELSRLESVEFSPEKSELQLHISQARYECQE